MKNRTYRVGVYLFGAALGLSLVVLPDSQVQPAVADSVSDSNVYIDEPLQGGSLTNWTLQGSGNYSTNSGATGAAWKPLQTTVVQNNALYHSTYTNNCGSGVTPDHWPLCTATRNNTRDSAWLTLTTDNTNSGAGQAGTAVYNDSFSSDLGVVLEYDQRVYRTNNGRSGGTPANQGGGDGIAVYLADADGESYGNTGVDTSVGEAGGYGAGLGYSAVSNTGDAWCPAQQGVAGGYLGVGFDVYGNYQKAETQQGFGQYHRATRPNSVALGNSASFSGVSSPVYASRIPQSIGLRGSGIRFNSTPNCDSNTTGGMNSAYGLLQTNTRLVTTTGYTTLFQVKWTAGDTASMYTGQYQVGGGAWTNVAAQEVSADQLPTGFTDTRGYVMFKVPASAATFNFQYSKNGTSAGSAFSNIAGSTNSGGDVSLGTAPNYTALYRYVGGYRWLAGTNNLSNYANPTTTALIANNQAALQGAVIDNTVTDSTHYRRVRVTLTPKGDGTREVTVYWTDKLDVANDVCYASNGVELTGRSANGTTDTCVNPTGGATAGTWSYDKELPLTYTKLFSYDLTESEYQADLPSNFKLGFSASTGWAVNHHQIRNLRVTTVVDLEMNKKVAFIGDSSAVPTDVNWKDEDSGTAGEQVAYRIEAWNNGPASVAKEYPATLTDGLDAVPFQDANAVEWTATATGGAQICTEWNGAELKCTSWGTTLSGTGPISDGNPLRWVSPSRSEQNSSGITVVFTGSVSTGESNSPEISADVNYTNTAAVATSIYGGAVDSDPTNNTDDATIRIDPTLQVDKYWVVNGQRYENGDQPEVAGEAQLSLSVPGNAVSGAAFGTPSRVTSGSAVTVGETLSGMSEKCTVESQKVTAVNGTTKDVPLGSKGYQHTVVSSPITNTIELTNTLNCVTVTQKLTLVKQVQNPDHSVLESVLLDDGDWTLQASESDGDTVVSGVSGASEVTAVEVPIGSYQLSEAAVGDAVSSGAYAAGNWTCATADDPQVEVTTAGVVLVGEGQDITCSITNSTAELSVLKFADSDHFESSDFTLSVAGDSQYPGLSGGVTGSAVVGSTNSTLVKPGQTYSIAEESKNANLAYVQKSFEQYVADSAECPEVPDAASLSRSSCWSEADPDDVTVAAGERAIYRFVNVSPSAPWLPLTGGVGTLTFTAAGGAIAAVGVAYAIFRRRRRA